ncbi:MAG: hypothetical protein ACLUU2_01695 [Anaerobutyricum hallii]
MEDNQSIRKTPMLIGANKMLGYSIAVVVHAAYGRIGLEKEKRRNICIYQISESSL